MRHLGLPSRLANKVRKIPLPHAAFLIMLKAGFKYFNFFRSVEMGIIVALLVGLLVGVLAKFLMGGGFGWILAIVLGLVGGFVGRFLFDLVGIGGDGLLWYIISGLAGACLILLVVRLVKRR